MITSYCGCCGELWQECVCPPGPTESFAEYERRCKEKICEHQFPEEEDE